MLASALSDLRDRQDLLVLGLPRGGVPVAWEVARELNAPLDVFVVRKLGVPGQEELAMGAIASGGVRVLNVEVIEALGISSAALEAVAARELRTLALRERTYRGDRPPPELAGRTVILVDDGLATGSTMRAAVAAVRHLGPERIIVAVPVAAPDTVRDFERDGIEVVCPLLPEDFYAVGAAYDEFDQTTDAEVVALLGAA